MKKIYIAPSILSADFAFLARDIQKVTDAGADILHVDVMDGHFVPNITIGPCVIKSIKKIAKIPLDVHLMISHPEKYLEAFAHAGSDWITFHIEATDNPKAFIQKAKKLGVKVGVSIKPGTSIEMIEPILKELDLILIMSVEPGFGGQKFQGEVLEKVKALRAFPECPENISIDGGINLETAHLAVKSGVNILVAGSAVFHSNDPAIVEKIRQAALSE